MKAIDEKSSENLIVTPELFREFAYNLLDMMREFGKEYDGILCPLRGGFFLSYFMSIHLNLPISYIEISSYADRIQGSFNIKYMPDIKAGRYLLCDDIFDTGGTIKKIHSLYPDAAFDTICLVSKQPDPPGVFYAALADKDVWVDFFWEIM